MRSTTSSHIRSWWANLYLFDRHVSAPEVRKALVRHLLLQPLENSIRHGTDPRSNDVTVTVTAERDGRNMRVLIRDSGRGLPKGQLRRSGSTVPDTRSN